jgi:hypothetical protein
LAISLGAQVDINLFLKNFKHGADSKGHHDESNAHQDACLPSSKSSIILAHNRSGCDKGQDTIEYKENSRSITKHSASPIVSALKAAVSLLKFTLLLTAYEDVDRNNV